MGLEKPYTKRIASTGEVVPITDHNKQEDQLEALTVFGNRAWTTGTRPTPNADDLYPVGFNTTLDVHEGWNGSAWVPLGGAAELDWERIGTTRLESRSNSILLSGLSCGLASASAKYRKIYFRVLLRAGAASVSLINLYANGDTTATNYWGAIGANNPTMDTNLLLGSEERIYDGFLFRSQGSSEENAYLWGYEKRQNTIGGAFMSGGAFADGWKWLNPNPDDVLENLEVKAMDDDFEIGCRAIAWGIRPGV